MTSRRQALALAGALTVTVFTAVVALAGFGRRPPAPAASPVTAGVAAQVSQAPAPAQTWRDD